MVTLVVLDVVIVVAAVWLSRPTTVEVSARAVEQSANGAAPAESASPIQAPLLLTGGPGDRLARATRGSCDADDPERARVWTGPADDLRVVRVPGLVEALGLAWTGGEVRITGADADCELRGWTSGDGGATWQEGRADRTVWRLDLDRTASVVHGPRRGAPEQIGCVPTQVQGTARSAVAVCRDSVVLLGGAPQDPQQVFSTQAVGAATTDGDAVLALATLDGCATLVRARTDGTSQRLGCVARDAAALGLVRSGGRLYAQAGRELHVSDDGRDFALVD